MSSEWPEYDHEALGDGRTWSGTFSSFNQRTDEVYYFITIHEADRDLPRFLVAVGIGLIPATEWETPEFPGKLRQQIVREAQKGKTNVP